jgi:hypothetical protein
LKAAFGLCFRENSQSRAGGDLPPSSARLSEDFAGAATRDGIPSQDLEFDRVIPLLATRDAHGAHDRLRHLAAESRARQTCWAR